MGSVTFPVPVYLTTAVLCGNVLNPQGLRGLSEGYWEVTERFIRRLLRGLSEGYYEVTMEYLGGYYGVSGRFIRIKKVFIYISSQKLFFATYITQYTALHTYYTILSYKINVSGHHLPTHQ